MKNLTISASAQRLILGSIFVFCLSLPAVAQTYTRTITTPVSYQGNHQSSVTETRIEVTITEEPTAPQVITRTVTVPQIVNRPVLVPAAPLLRPRGMLHGPFTLVRVLDGDSFIADFGDRSDVVNLIGLQSSLDVDYSILLGRLIGGRPFWLELDEFERGLDGNILAYLYVEDPLGEWHWNGLRLSQINLHMLETGIATYDPGINARYRDIYRQLPEDITYIETVPFVYRYEPDRLVDIDLQYLDPNFFTRPPAFTPRSRTTP